MIDQSRTKPMKAYDFRISSTVTTLTEGTALIQVFDTLDNVAKVQASAGSGEVFVGVAYSQMMTPVDFPRYEQVTVPSQSPYTVTLQKTPQAYTSIGVTRVSNNTLLTVDNGGSPATNHVASATNVLTFNSADAGQVMNVIYRYNLTVVEARTIAGDGVLGASNPVIEAGSVGVIQSGFVFTDQYDPTVNWNSSTVITDVKTGASGRFTRGGSGSTVSGYVIQAPMPDNPYLGLYFNN